MVVTIFGWLVLLAFVGTAVAMIFFVLIQQSKGGGLSGAFGGGGGSETFFGPSGATGIASLTIGLAIAFMVLAVLMEIVGPRTIAQYRLTPDLGAESSVPEAPAPPDATGDAGVADAPPVPAAE